MHPNKQTRVIMYNGDHITVNLHWACKVCNIEPLYESVVVSGLSCNIPIYKIFSALCQPTNPNYLLNTRLLFAASFSIPGGAIPAGNRFDVCAGTGLGTLLPRCTSFTHAQDGDASVTVSP
jgi:hypothetical protein